MAFFKIVTTVEKRGVLFSLVPHQWEQNGVLFWPQHLNHKRRDALRSNAASVPEDGWISLPCIVKVDQVKSFQDGLVLEKNLSDCTDTEAEERLFSSTTLPAARNKKKTDGSSQLNLNYMFDQINNGSQQEGVEEVPTDGAVIPINRETPADLNDGSSTINLGFSGSFDPNILNKTIPITPIDFSFEFKHIKEELGEMKGGLNDFKNEMRKQLKDGLDKINVIVDKIFEQLGNRNFTPVEEKLVAEVDLLQDFQFPLKSCEEVSLLDSNIRKDANFRAQLINLLSKIGGQSGVQDGMKVGYKLVDHVFSPEVLINYSWTGVSRGPIKDKRSFQILNAVIDLFFDVILLADTRHTTQKNSSLFKDGVLKHAKKRI